MPVGYFQKKGKEKNFSQTVAILHVSPLHFPDFRYTGLNGCESWGLG